MTEKILFKDKAGNTLIMNNLSLGVRNKHNKLVDDKEFLKFMVKNKIFKDEN